MSDSKSSSYEAPAVTDIGSLSDLTGGGKWNSLADINSGQVEQGPGS